MRKGRSQRRSRHSRVPAPPKSASQVEVQPQLVSATSRSVTATELLDSVKTESSPAWDDVQRKGRSELATPIDPTMPSEPAAVAVAPDPVVGAAHAAEPRAEERSQDEPKSLEAVVTAVAPTSADLVVRSPVDAAAANPDDVSIPPASDLAHVDETFFSEGDLCEHLGHEPDEEQWDADRKKVAKHAPHVVARREKFARYVRWAVAAAAVVCVAALARTFVMPLASSTPAATNARGGGEVVQIDPSPNAAPEAPKPTAPTVALTAQAAAPKPVEPKPVAPNAAPIEQADAPKPAELRPYAKSALEEKNDSRKALERGKLDDAIAAGERSVALDTEDGEAWLILGAAYQEKGKLAEARRCYSSCMKQGKRGPRHECAAMLR